MRNSSVPQADLPDTVASPQALPLEERCESFLQKRWVPGPFRPPDPGHGLGEGQWGRLGGTQARAALNAPLTLQSPFGLAEKEG